MKITQFLAAAVLCAFASTTAAQPKLHLQVYTSSGQGFSVNSTLISGERDAILIDPQFLLSEAHRLAALILESGKRLTTVYVTHAHPDHYFGLAVMRQAFPEARFVALPEVVAGIERGWEARYHFWKATYGDNLPPPPPILPEPLTGSSLTLEGETLEIVGGVQGDGPGNSYVWIPSLDAVVAGDIVFSGAHFVVPKDHAEWVQAIDRIAAYEPRIVVPGHQTEGAPNDASTLEFMRKYMRDFDAAVASSKTPEEVQSRMRRRYPDLGLEALLAAGARAAFPQQ
jgi:glyoxylase-like metal-dependent hydrolase (beta-lactamase superfamily II)